MSDRAERGRCPLNASKHRWSCSGRERCRDSGRNRHDHSAVGWPGKHATSGSDGSYRFDGLPDGTYRVDFDLRRFELVRRNHVRVSRDAEARIDAALQVRAICECVAIEPPSPWTQRPGQVVDKTGRPLPHARIQLVGREEAYTDNEGRFFIRVPVYEKWPLTASDTGFRSVTQQVSGDDSATVVLSLEYVGTTGVPDVQRFGGCECPGGNLLPHAER